MKKYIVKVAIIVGVSMISFLIKEDEKKTVNSCYNVILPLPKYLSFVRFSWFNAFLCGFMGDPSMLLKLLYVFKLSGIEHVHSPMINSLPLGIFMPPKETLGGI